MKKIFISLVLLAGFLAAITLNSCNKANKATADPVTTTATIKGKVQAQLDLTNATIENAPSGTKITAWINASDLVDNPPAGTNGKIIFNGTVDNNGEYTLTITAGTKPVTVTIYGDDFVYNTIWSTTSAIRTIYTGATGSATVQKGVTKYVDLSY
ncbi:MAG: hypothetical protein HY958_09410 [Bacteroidia bacterium]|nr:hypothetical protein [Bacteroidia bacterium]